MGNVIDAINNLTSNGVRVEVAFEERSIQRFLLWGVIAAVVAAVLTTFVKKALGG